MKLDPAGTQEIRLEDIIEELPVARPRPRPQPRASVPAPAAVIASPVAPAPASVPGPVLPPAPARVVAPAGATQEIQAVDILEMVEALPAPRTAVEAVEAVAETTLPRPVKSPAAELAELPPPPQSVLAMLPPPPAAPMTPLPSVIVAPSRPSLPSLPPLTPPPRRSLVTLPPSPVDPAFDPKLSELSDVPAAQPAWKRSQADISFEFEVDTSRAILGPPRRRLGWVVGSAVALSLVILIVGLARRGGEEDANAATTTTQTSTATVAAQVPVQAVSPPVPASTQWTSTADAPQALPLDVPPPPPIAEAAFPPAGASLAPVRAARPRVDPPVVARVAAPTPRPRTAAPPPPPASPPPAEAARPAAASAKACTGTIVGTGHLLIVDNAQAEGSTAVVRCGRHTVKLSWFKKPRTVDVTSGGRVTVSAD